MDTRALRELVLEDGPFVSVYFAAPGEEDVARLRWRALRDQLEAQDADETALATVDLRVRHRPYAPGLTGRAIIASGERVLLDRRLPVRPRASTARFSAWPYLLPLAELAEPLLPHLVVHMNDHGADLCGMDQSGSAVAVASVGAGVGLAPRRSTGSVDNFMRDHVEDVAGEVVKLVEHLRARLVVLAGEPPARSALRSILPSRCRRMCVEVGPTQRRGNDREIQLLATRGYRQEQRALVRRFRSDSSRFRGTTVHGMREVTAALRAGEVETLLLTDTVLSGRSLWTDSDPWHVSADGAILPFKGRADEVLPRAAVISGAEIVLVGRELRLHEDVGALLRR